MVTGGRKPWSAGADLNHRRYRPDRLRLPGARSDNRAVEGSSALNRHELRRYVQRIDDRWTIEIALLAGARLADERGARPQRERGPEFILILVSSAYEGMPWLERVHCAGTLWDAREMGARAEVHCYTPAEFERRRITLPVVRKAVAEGIDLLILS